MLFGVLHSSSVKKIWNSGRNGIGDWMDKLNLWLLPWFTLVFFAAIWTTKLWDKHRLRTADSKFKSCSLFGVPIVFVIGVTRFIWCWLMMSRDIDFDRVISTSKSVKVNDKVDVECLLRKLPVISSDFRLYASSGSVFVAFLTFELWLLLAPLLLLLFVLPWMVGARFRTWGLDILRTSWEGRYSEGSPLIPFFGISSSDSMLVPPLFPRTPNCYYEKESDKFLYKCHLEAKWHEWTALIIWAMLALLTLLNLANFIIWLQWGIRMRNPTKRGNWVLKKWLPNADVYGLFNAELDVDMMRLYAQRFYLGQLLYLYYIECHTDRYVASAFFMALFREWIDGRPRERPEMTVEMQVRSDTTSGEDSGGQEGIENPD